MVLIRILTLECLIYNVRVFAKYVSTKENVLADALSRGQIDRFRNNSVELNMEEFATAIPNSIWPMAKLWLI